jgi:hypothetical protein
MGNKKTGFWPVVLKYDDKRLMFVNQMQGKEFKK